MSKKRNGKNGTSKRIGELIKTARLKRNLSADDAAESCNVSRSRWYMWEAGDYVFPKNFRAISATLRIPVTKLRDANGPRP